MDSHYSVGVSNRFSLFYEDDDNPGDSVESAAKDTSREKTAVREERKATVITAGGKTKDNKDKHQQVTENQSGSKKTPTTESSSKGIKYSA